MKQLILETNGIVTQIGGKLTSSEIGRQKAGYDFSVPFYGQPEYVPTPAGLRFLVLTLTDDTNPDEDAERPVKKNCNLTAGNAGDPPKFSSTDSHHPTTSADLLACLPEIWDYAESNGIHDIYLLPDTSLVRERYGFFTFVSLFPERDGIKLHLCATANISSSLRFRDFQDISQMQSFALLSDPVEAVQEGSKIYLLSDDQSPDPEERAQMNSLEHPPSRLKGHRQQSYEYLLYEFIHRMDLLCDDLIGAKYIFSKGWSNDLMLMDNGQILLPVNGCVDVCAEI